MPASRLSMTNLLPCVSDFKDRLVKAQLQGTEYTVDVLCDFNGQGTSLCVDHNNIRVVVWRRKESAQRGEHQSTADILGRTDLLIPFEEEDASTSGAIRAML
jgi:hypothetical protein